MENQRDLLFDNIRGILIFLVILGHALEYFRLTNEAAEFLYVFIYLFHMPVFIFISGYFSKNVEKGRATAAKTFLIPYLLLNLILSTIMFAMGKIDQIAILNPGWTLWYLYCMFLWRLLLPDLVKVRHVVILSFIIGIFSGFLTEFGSYMAMARTLGFLPYFLAGYFCKPEYIEKIRTLPLRRTLSLAIIGIGLGTAYEWTDVHLPAEILWGDRAYGLFEVPLYQVVLADGYLYVLSFAFVFAFLVLTSRKQRFFTIWGQSTLAIYLLHVYLVAPLVGGSELIKDPLAHFLILIGGAVVIVYLLSRRIVSRRLSWVLAKVTHYIMPNKPEN